MEPMEVTLLGTCTLCSWQGQDAKALGLMDVEVGGMTMEVADPQELQSKHNLKLGG